MPGAQTTAFADGTDKAIVPGVAGLNDPVFSNGYYYPSDYIYFGLYQGSPLKWRVLDADKAFDKQTDGVFLLTEELMEEMRSHLPEGVPSVFISSVSGLNIQTLKDMLWEALQK